MARPLTGWTVDFGDQRCLAMRRFTVGKGNMVFGIEPDTDGRGAGFIFRPDQPSNNATPGWHIAQLSVDGRKLSQQLIIWPDTQQGVLLMSGYHLDDKDPPLALESAQTVSLHSPVLSTTLPLGPISKVVPLLIECNAGLLESWGFSRPDQARMAVRPKGSIMRFFDSGDYPQESIRRGAQGQVAVRYTVGADGKASGCAVRMSSGEAALDRATCNVINQRVRLTPAKDHSGQPMAMIDTARVRWVMPGFGGLEDQRGRR
jgi:TonB family protein